VWRATTSADWEGAALVPAADLAQERGMRSTTLRGQCLDDIVVGVRSVSALGARSRVTTPPEPDAFEARR
jgi:hypothetical protein